MTIRTKKEFLNFAPICPHRRGKDEAGAACHIYGQTASFSCSYKNCPLVVGKCPLDGHEVNNRSLECDPHNCEIAFHGACDGPILSD